MAFVSPVVTLGGTRRSALSSSRHHSRPAFSVAPRMTASPPIVSPVPVQSDDDGPTEVLELSLENVEMVLDEMRPYLISDGKLRSSERTLR